MGEFKSSVSGKRFPESQRVNAAIIRPSILKKIQEEHPDFNMDGCISLSELNEFRNKYIESQLDNELGTLTKLEKEVIDAIHNNQLISDNVDAAIDEKLTAGQRIADKVASFGGSWTFILSFFFFLVCWILVNVLFLRSKTFDPYPFILLNLILSCLAALQAPVIMMSQNRQEEKDRERAKHDYQVNLKAELEIRMLHEKIDHLVLTQQQHLFEIQQIQVEMLNEISERLEKNRPD